MEKPILFNTEMVKAILEGRKTCTRRIVKGVTGLDFIGTSSEDGSIFNHVAFGHGNFDDIVNAKIEKRIKAPYLPGDILYVRETWAKIEDFENYADLELEDGLEVLYKCDDYGKEHVFVDVGVKRWHPSIHMPKAAARIFLKVKDVRIERLQDITEEGAKSEGATKQLWYQPYGTKLEGSQKYIGDITDHQPNYITGFAHIWDKTLGKHDDWLYKFNENPWVWVIEFERIDSQK